ncbi:ATP-dependent metallopeptidase HflB [Allomyces macrogynus ATCC 38327]|uniref:ATP-dependent metallopeptidase HflB n=1 Tax=Allomyces macrogynus (strain ATCC 38327) TaxID=578462 RepID=A0A0L0S5J9_ALLM3|nr:ATP-dependent metallopeptidase HflB [Allomyces macrogynus ATCC 38327]|eukprot:KNE57639.1 ATP-dependent metallopeptidase HflB [Allomyces macrogynus ATCC 38327]
MRIAHVARVRAPSAARLSRAFTLAATATATIRRPAWLPPSALAAPQHRTLFASTTPTNPTASPLLRPLANRRLDRLLADANATPFDAAVQADFAREWLRGGGDPLAIIARVERGPTAAAINDDVLRWYAVALAQAGLADKIVPNLRALARQFPQVMAGSAAAAALGIRAGENGPAGEHPATANTGAGPSAAATGAGAAGAATVGQSPTASAPLTLPGSSASIPLHVVLPEKPDFSFKSAASSLFRTTLWAFFLLTGISLFLDNQGIVRGHGGTPGLPGGHGGALGGHGHGPPGGVAGHEIVDALAKPTVRFRDVAGVDEAKQELEELVDFLRDPDRFTHLGGKMPRGVLLTGPPGTGKTMLARAVAGEAGVPFFFMSGSEFDELYVGVGARRVRELFAAARRKSPAIIFIDELDAIGGKRNPKDQSYMRQTLNQLLVELDGFAQTEGVIVMAATNFPELLDKALVRPGRFDKHVDVPLPDVRGRMQILGVHCNAINVDASVDVAVIARGTPGFSGAELANLVNHAAIQAAREGHATVLPRHFEHAKDKLLMGAERTSAVITAASKRCTAYHEGGHALVAMLTAGAIPLHKATVLPRGRSLGMTVQLPELDKDNYTKTEYLAMMDVAMGGRAAEELLYGADHVTSGAHNDLQQATNIARRMVTQLGMSDAVGMMAISDDDWAALSPATKELVENETRRLVEHAYRRAKGVLKANQDGLARLANALVEYETLTREEMERAVKGVEPVRRNEEEVVVPGAATSRSARAAARSAADQAASAHARS